MNDFSEAASSSHVGGRPPLLSHGLINQLIKIGEILCLIGGGYCANPATSQLTTLQSLLLPLLAVLPYRLINARRREYFRSGYDQMVLELLEAVAGIICGAILIEFYSWAFHPHGWLGGWLWRWILLVGVAILILRLLVRRIVHDLYRRGKLIHRVAIVGAGPECEALIALLMSQKYKARNYQIVGIYDERFPDRRFDNICGMPVQQGLEPLLALAQTTSINTIIVTWSVSTIRVAATMEAVRPIPADILVLMDFEWLQTGQMRISRLEKSWYLQVAHRPMIGTRTLLKSIEDYVVASIAILVTSPIMLLAALAIWREGDGPILFKQKRVGFNNNEFEMLKFRSMTTTPTADGRGGTTRDDPRVTRVGRFLRRSSIDELPQLFNVLRGEMSVVGPRAHVPDMLVGEQTYREIVVKYAARHRVKPGITGWAQINGMRGGIRDEQKARRGVELDLDYIDNWSLWLDVKIMIRTLLGGLWGPEIF